MSTRNTDRNVTGRLTLDPDVARRAVGAADMRALLMMLFHHTGDRYWLSERFRPVRDIRLIAPEDAGLPADVQDEIRDAAGAVLTGTGDPVVPQPDDVLFLEMMRIALGESVPSEYLPMMREQMGLTSLLGDEGRRESVPAADSPTVLIVGAGESGIVLGAILNDLGVDYRIVERAAMIGGTWRDNIYPGCAVDTPNHSYSYSFGARYRWSRFFSERGEIQSYLHRCTDEFGVRDRISFNTRCVSATWDEDTAQWRVLLEHDGSREFLEARFLVSAIGPFGEPQIPRIDGVERFSGPALHSAAWPHDLDVSGKSVAILGTGASCMQIAPEIADRVQRLTILQRTPQWVRPIPRFRELIDDDVQVLLEKEPYFSAWYRFVMLWRYGDGLLATLRKDPAWPHPERSMNRVNDRHRQQMTQHIHDVLRDRSDLIAKCVPDYPPYGKRILLDNGWYETLCKPNVDLVTQSIERIEPEGVRLTDGSLAEADLLVFATGFDVSRNASRIDIRGSGGVTLADTWAKGIGAYLGITVPNFPNFFIMQGPTTGLAHGGSLIFTSEMQARYIGLAICQATDSDIAAIDVKQSVHDRYIERVDAEHAQLVWSHPGMLPYYRDAFGKIRMVLPWRMVDYFHMTRRPDLTEFELTYATPLHPEVA
ncbi:MAG: 4-hydroxyacetophenone monooxygenase [Mycobacterium sp.]|jgi:4-hydroxyacetophenone monooxygenase|nr:4-hydroxyacetophenone monooxygenase [Mycobacterium sp.]MDT5320469.1 4-hydroxyacetophenone monooxygenase [Mycobacterium sp.]